MEHKSFCNGDCDEGRECWRMNLLSKEEAERRGIKLLEWEDIEKMLRGED